MSEALAGSRPEIEMANGVLIQAKRDLRRFRGAQDPVGRQMFQDAYSWFVSNDFSWPYSFLNVCEILGLTPDYVRDDLLGPTPPGCCARSRRAMQRVSALFEDLWIAFFSLVAAPRNHLTWPNRLPPFEQMNKSTNEHMKPNRFSRFWRSILRCPVPRHDPWLMLNLTQFNFSDGWIRTFSRQFYARFSD